MAHLLTGCRQRQCAVLCWRRVFPNQESDSRLFFDVPSVTGVDSKYRTKWAEGGVMKKATVEQANRRKYYPVIVVTGWTTGGAHLENTTKSISQPGAEIDCRAPRTWAQASSGLHKHVWTSQ